MCCSCFKRFVFYKVHCGDCFPKKGVCQKSDAIVETFNCRSRMLPIAVKLRDKHCRGALNALDNNTLKGVFVDALLPRS